VSAEPSFKDQGWEQRFTRLGDEAEGVFEEVYPHGKARFGLDRPPIQLHRISAFTRYTPDYITSAGLVEVQGLGRDRTFKLKDDKLAALEQWAQHETVRLFVWDNVARRWGLIELPDLIAALAANGERGSFDNGTKPYTSLHVDALPTDWTAR
jgi:hypothetical protein